MDTGKLLKIIEDIQKDEQAFNFQARFQNILNFYNENNPEALNNEKESMRADLERSLVSGYVMTDYKILQKLNIANFFGINSQQELNNILNSQAHEVKSKLETFINQRQDTLSKLDNIKNSLVAFGVKPRTLEDNEYEIGFSFPEEYAELENLEDVFGDIKNFLVSLADALGESKSFKIKYVNNGSIDMFIGVGLELAQHFDTALDYTLKIYASIKVYQDLKNGYQNYAKKRKEAMEKVNREEMVERANNLVEELIKILKINEPAEATSVRLLFKKMLKHFEKGVSAEVRTPSIPEPEEPPTDAEEDVKKNFKEKKKLYELKKGIDEKNKEIFILQQNNFFGMDTKFLNEVTNDEDRKSKDDEGKNVT